MKVIKEKYAEGCLEGKNVWDFALDEDITKSYIDSIGPAGKLIYNSAFNRPFFRLIVKGKYTLKGVEGKKSVRAILPEGAGSEIRAEIWRILSVSEV